MNAYCRCIYILLALMIVDDSAEMYRLVVERPVV